MTSAPAITYRALTADELDDRLDELVSLLHDCVHDGASVNFVMPFPRAEAEHFWRSMVLGPARRGDRTILIAEAAGRIVGSVQLDCDTPPNQPHRAEVTKLLVHPDFRRRGIARRLMQDLEALAIRRGRSLITLDTRTGDSAEPLYTSLGYQTVGSIPGFSRDVFTDRLDATTLMYRTL
ncbi:GNAT family N-acetyltransferase [Minwuia sp.]|uniref:GNAT family N-acetyltransferase n=1 Tax=Minwuia sp. TaxID=2493630 RepID=UPI003A8FD91E